jgi:hypothetical protein
VAKGQFSRLAQYEIEVENPLRPKEIQDRIRAGETADEIADAAGIPPDRVRRFEGPVLAERQYRAQEAQRATIRGHADSGPGPRLGDVVGERLVLAGAAADSTEWDSRKRPDGNWQVQLRFSIGGRAGSAQWIYDPRRRHVIPDDNQAVRLSLPQADWASVQFSDRAQAHATVTPIGARHAAQQPDAARDPELMAVPSAVGRESVAPRASRAGTSAVDDLAAQAMPAAAPDLVAEPGADAGKPAEAARPARKTAGSRSRRSSVPSWDEIMFGTSRQPD